MRANIQGRVNEKVSTGLLRMSYWAQAALHRCLQGTATLSAHEAEIISDLTTEGVHVSSVERLFPDLAPKLHDSLVRVADFIAKGSADTASPSLRRRVVSTDLRSEELLRLFPEIYLLGLEPRILALAERYLGLPVAYHGAALRQSFVDGHQLGPRLWHMDSEDFHVLRVVIYLSDVTPGCGPFEYIPRSKGLSYKSFPGIQPITNERMRTVVPEDQWKRCVGPVGTVVLADSAQTFHHESLQVERSRTVAMIGYSSRRPKIMNLATSHFPVESLTPELTGMLSPPQHAYVFGWRRTI
jgi:hypothetical protein